MARTTPCQTCKIRTLNDQLRKTGQGGRVMITRALNDKGPYFTQTVLSAMADFDAFTAENDPHGEHDFGEVVVGAHTIFWKIDYYDKSMNYGSDDPSDPDQTKRVLTIMFSSEY